MGVIEYDGTLMHMRALDGYDQALTDRLAQSYPRPPGPETMSGRAVLSGRIIHIRDMAADAGISQTRPRPRRGYAPRRAVACATAG